MRSENVHIDAERIQAAIPLCNIENTSIREFKVVLTRCTVEHRDGYLDTSPPISMKYTIDKTGSENTVLVSVTKADREIEDPIRRSARVKKPMKMEVSVDVQPTPISKNRAIISSAQMTTILWRELTMQFTEIDIGMIVCAKMSTFWPWPAQITRFQRDRAHVKIIIHFQPVPIHFYCFYFYLNQMVSIMDLRNRVIGK